MSSKMFSQAKPWVKRRSTYSKDDSKELNEGELLK